MTYRLEATRTEVLIYEIEAESPHAAHAFWAKRRDLQPVDRDVLSGEGFVQLVDANGHECSISDCEPEGAR